MKTGAELITDERQRQIDSEGWTPEHDDEHDDGELAQAAAIYTAVSEAPHFAIQVAQDPHGLGWPWDIAWFKPYKEMRPNQEFPEVDKVRCLVKAGALIAAEIDRLQRAS